MLPWENANAPTCLTRRRDGSVSAPPEKRRWNAGGRMALAKRRRLPWPREADSVSDHQVPHRVPPSRPRLRAPLTRRRVPSPQCHTSSSPLVSLQPLLRSSVRTSLLDSLTLIRLSLSFTSFQSLHLSWGTLDTVFPFNPLTLFPA